MTTVETLRDLEHFTNAFFDAGRRGPRQMPMDLYRLGDRYILSADLPGIDPGSVDIDVDGQLLTIRAERTLTTDEGATWIARERTGGTFLRQLTLGQGLDTEGITAGYDNGVLSVTIPLSEKAKPRKIEITSTSDTRQIEPSAG